MKKYVLLISVGLLFGCASALKKQCESTNWFDHGFQFAMTGKRLNADPFIEQCKKEDVDVREAELDLGFKAGMQNYCKPEVVYITGKNGESLNIDFCDPSQAKILQKKHADGIEQYCQKDNGYSVGSSGKIYTQVCPKDLEANFLKEYRRGRKVYLGQTILNREQENNELERQANDLQSENQRKMHEMAMVPPNQVPHFWPSMSIADQSAEQQRVDRENTDLNYRRQNIQFEINENNNKIVNIRGKQTENRNQIFEMRKEKEAIENQ